VGWHNGSSCKLLHLDGSRHGWLALVPGALQTLIAVVDDATKQVLYAQLVEEGASNSIPLQSPNRDLGNAPVCT